jgi:hypothetical protein
LLSGDACRDGNPVGIRRTTDAGGIPMPASSDCAHRVAMTRRGGR